MNNFLTRVINKISSAGQGGRFLSSDQDLELPVQNYELLIAELRPVKIYIDTCSLLRPGSLSQLKQLSIAAERQQQRLIIFKSVIRELERVSQRESKLGERASPMFRSLHTLKSEVLLEVIEGSDRHFSDFNFLEAIVKDIRKMNVLIVSNDKALAASAKDIVDAMKPSIRINHTVTTIKFK